MTLRIVSGDERKAEARGVQVVILGKNGIGKASALFACSLPGFLFPSGGNQDEGVSE